LGFKEMPAFAFHFGCGYAALGYPQNPEFHFEHRQMAALLKFAR